MAVKRLIHHRGSELVRAGCRAGRPDRVARILLLTLMGGASLLATVGAQAQSACDQLKTSLAGRLHADPRSYTLEAVTAGTPVPPGAKVVGTCEGGARKILFIRGAAAASAFAKLSKVEPASAPAPAPAPASASASASADLQPKPKPLSAAALAPPLLRPIDATPAMVSPLVESKPSADVVATADAPATDPGAELSLRRMRVDDAAGDQPSLVDRTSRFAVAYWQWLLALVLLPLGLAGWAWLDHHRTYDAAGLPRGPRL